MNLAYLKKQWLPISAVKEISHRPQRFLLLDSPLLIFRFNKQIFALQDRCPHRGVPLSLGKLHNGILQCAYHGWCFNTAGECIKIPGLTKKINFSNKNLPTYPTQIHLGMVFVCLEKSEETLPLYTTPFLLSKKYRSYLLTFKLNGNILNIIENVLDATHTNFIHGGLLRSYYKRQLVTAALEVNETTAKVTYENEIKQAGWVSTIFENKRKFSIGRFHLPIIAELEYHGYDDLTAAFTFFLSPINSFNKEQKVFFLVTFRKTWINYIKNFFLKVLIALAIKQDKAILKEQEANCAYFPNTSFKSTELDILRPHIKSILDRKASNYQKKINLNL